MLQHSYCGTITEPDEIRHFHVVAKKCLRHVYSSRFTRREGNPRKRVTLALALTRRVYKASIGLP